MAGEWLHIFVRKQRAKIDESQNQWEASGWSGLFALARNICQMM